MEPNGHPLLDASTMGWMKHFEFSDSQLRLAARMLHSKPASPCEVALILLGEPLMKCDPVVYYIDTRRPELRVRSFTQSQ